MADFCSLCGYSDIDIESLYEKWFKKDTSCFKEILKQEDGTPLILNGIGVCEHCGLVSFGVNNKLEVIANYYKDDVLKIGHVNPETFELTLYEDLERYAEQRNRMKKELELMNKEFDRFNVLQSYIDVDDPEIKELYDNWKDSNFYDEIGLLEILIYQRIKDYNSRYGETNGKKQYHVNYEDDYKDIQLRIGKPKKYKDEK